MLVDSLPAEPQEKPEHTGTGSISHLQWIFPNQESNQGLLHHRQILYQLSSQGNQRFSDEIKEWDSYCALANEGDGEATQGILLTRILFFQYIKFTQKHILKMYNFSFFNKV